MIEKSLIGASEAFLMTSELLLNYSIQHSSYWQADSR